MWWAFFHRCGFTEEEHVESRATLGALTYAGEAGQVKHSVIHRYRFPEQPHEIGGRRLAETPTRGGQPAAGGRSTWSAAFPPRIEVPRGSSERASGFSVREGLVAHGEVRRPADRPSPRRLGAPPCRGRRAATRPTRERADESLTCSPAGSGSG